MGRIKGKEKGNKNEIKVMFFFAKRRGETRLMLETGVRRVVFRMIRQIKCMLVFELT